MSGAGKTQAIRSLEDLGYFCVDNLPPTFIPKFAELCLESEGKIRRIALVVDIRGGEFFDSTFEALEQLEKMGFVYQILFLEAADEALIRRFKETRRRHPLAPEGRIVEALKVERRRLEELRGRANVIIDTTELTPAKLRQQVAAIFSREGVTPRLTISVVSFGFKFGLPVDADLVFDVRFLPNPHYVESLRELDGNDAPVRDYLFKWPLTQRFMTKLLDFVHFLIPHYTSEGKSQLVVAIGCTGGQHRSVVVVNRLAEMLRGRGHRVLVEHRDIERDRRVDEA